MRVFRFLVVFAMLAIFLLSCSGDSDNGGTTGGSGDTQTSTDEENGQSGVNDTADNTSSAGTTSSQAGSDVVLLDAHTFNCTSNWTDRDGSLGLVAYSGSGNCSKSFSGAPGTYQLVLKAVTEYDGEPPYRVSINGNVIKSGTYSLSTPMGCDCPIDQWRTVCPDRTQDIDLGTHNLVTGDLIEFWGDDVYPCGGHGAYAKWNGIMAVRK